MKITATLITMNEADRVANTLRSVEKLVDEIVVIDSGSTDDTIAICESFGARVVHNDWNGFGPQKRVAEDVASHDWILNLDADEVILEDLAAEIFELKQKNEPECKGYRFRQIHVYPGHTKPRLFADYHNFIRLYDRRAMRFQNSLVFDTVDNNGLHVGQLKGRCYHFSIRSLDHMVAKQDSYIKLQAREIRRPIWKLWIRYLLEYPFQFTKHMVMRRHITGGWFGLLFSHKIAKAKQLRISKLIDAQK